MAIGAGRLLLLLAVALTWGGCGLAGTIDEGAGERLRVTASTNGQTFTYFEACEAAVETNDRLHELIPIYSDPGEGYNWGGDLDSQSKVDPDDPCGPLGVPAMLEGRPDEPCCLNIAVLGLRDPDALDPVAEEASEGNTGADEGEDEGSSSQSSDGSASEDNGDEGEGDEDEPGWDAFWQWLQRNEEDNDDADPSPQPTGFPAADYWVGDEESCPNAHPADDPTVAPWIEDYRRVAGRCLPSCGQILELAEARGWGTGGTCEARTANCAGQAYAAYDCATCCVTGAVRATVVKDPDGCCNVLAHARVIDDSKTNDHAKNRNNFCFLADSSHRCFEHCGWVGNQPDWVSGHENFQALCR